MDARRRARRNWLMFGLVAIGVVAAAFLAYWAFMVDTMASFG
jgi:hypothetical protein